MNFFEDKFQYSHISNEKIIKQLTENPNTFIARIEELICHTLNAHTVWNERILKISPSVTTFQLHPLERLSKINNSNFEQSLHILKTVDCEKQLNYTNSQGLPFINSITDILFHIINHSTYHRGQLISLLKLEGIQPVVTDYIFYKRN